MAHCVLQQWEDRLGDGSSPVQNVALQVRAKRTNQSCVQPAVCGLGGEGWALRWGQGMPAIQPAQPGMGQPS